MKVLIFQAATSQAAIAAVTLGADRLRAAGHHVGLRNLTHFRRESEPAERVVVALTPVEAARLKTQGLELVQTFGRDMIKLVELPEDPEELKSFDWADVVDDLDKDAPTANGMTLEQLKAEAVLRGIEVRPDSTAHELAHLLDIDQPVGAQEAERRFDRQAAEVTIGSARVGLRTSSILPTVNGLDIERMNDEQLAAAAAQMGIKAPRNVKRETLINKMTSLYAEAVGAPEGSSPKADPGGNPPFGEGEGMRPFDDGLADLDEDGLRAVAEAESIDLGRATSVDGLREKIVEARKESATEE
jgi:hypothetical protein